jgi:hypothetical protein
MQARQTDTIRATEIEQQTTPDAPPNFGHHLSQRYCHAFLYIGAG